MTPKLEPCECYRQVHVACWEWNIKLSLDYIYINFPSLFHFSLVPSGPQISGLSGKSFAVRLPHPLSHCSLFLSAQTLNFLLFFFCSNCTLYVSFGPTCSFSMYICIRMITNNFTMESASSYTEISLINEIGQNSSM